MKEDEFTNQFKRIKNNTKSWDTDPQVEKEELAEWFRIFCKLDVGIFSEAITYWLKHLNLNRAMPGTALLMNCYNQVREPEKPKESAPGSPMPREFHDVCMNAGGKRVEVRDADWTHIGDMIRDMFVEKWVVPAMGNMKKIRMQEEKKDRPVSDLLEFTNGQRSCYYCQGSLVNMYKENSSDIDRLYCQECKVSYIFRSKNAEFAAELK